MTRNKSILITGAASGIGRAVALFFARKGWYTGLFDLNKNGLISLSAEIGPENCCFDVMDVIDPVSVSEGARNFSKNTGGRLDVFFANAGTLRMGYNEDISINDQHHIVDVNIKGVLNSIHAGMNILKNTKGSRFIIMSSGSALTGVPHLAAYSATKAAVSSLAESLSLELERHGISVCDIMVPYVNTPLLDQDVRAASIGKLGINLKPDDAAELVWKAAHGKRIHYSRGMIPFYLLMKLPYFIRRPLLKSLLLPSENQGKNIYGASN